MNLPENLLLDEKAFPDIIAQFNIREWLQSALENKGAKVTGAGVGLGGSDLDFELEGHKFNVFVKFL